MTATPATAAAPVIIGLRAGEIRSCADAVLSHFDDVPVRSHVMTLAHRRTRECLASDHCHELVEA